MTTGGREYLIDVSRLIWRAWRRQLPTGIDRVCLEYVAHFGSRAHAVVQRKGATFVLSQGHSDRLFDLILNAPATKRSAFVALGSTAWARARRKTPRPGMLYLNVGHTGLDNPALPRWIARNGVKAVYLIHDMIPITHPEFCRSGEAAKHRRRMRNALVSGSGIIANSRATLLEVERFAEPRRLPLPPATVAWISGPRLPSKPTAAKVDRPHFVTLGTIEGRKNHKVLLDVWARFASDLANKTPKLVIIGQRGWEADPIFEKLDGGAAFRGSVIELNKCSDDEAAEWLAGARALLMPSFAEGFGLPVIEAFELGTPVIASDLPVYREIVGDVPTYLDPLDEGGWYKTITSFINPEEPERLRQLDALKEFKGPNWPGHFAQVETWLKSL